MNILRYAFRNIFRNIFLSLSSILIIGLLAFFVNILLFVLFSTETFIESINNRISLTINLKEWMDDTTPRVRTLMRGITGAFTGINLEYTSREEALSLLAERNPDLASLASAWDENPLPASLRLRNIPLDSYIGLNTYISSFQDVLEYNEEDIRKKIVDYRAQYTRVEAVVHNLRLLEYGVYILLALFAFTVFVVVHTVIRNFIFYLRDEIEIIELVGWKTSFIYIPFLLQALFYTLVATLLAFGSIVLLIQVFLQTEILPVFTKVFEWFQVFFSVVGTLSIIVFILLTILSSFLATFKYIHGTIRTR